VAGKMEVNVRDEGRIGCFKWIHPTGRHKVSPQLQSAD
jgi:hypothetical protein